MYVSCLGRWADGPVTVGGVTYERVDPGEPFSEAPRPVQDWPPPEPTAPERDAAMLAFVTGAPGDYKPYRTPRPDEHVSALSAFLTPGEFEPVWFGVQALAGLSGVEVTVEVGSAPVTVDVRHLHFWP